METWKTLSKEKVLEIGKWLSVETHTVELPDGRVITDWPWVITPDFVNVAVVDPEGRFLCFRQTKYAIKDGTSLSVVGGYIEPGEDPLLAAQRELREEMGYESDDWQFLGKFRHDPNRGVAEAHLYLAKGARFTSRLESDDLETMELVILSRAEVKKHLLDGDFKITSWAATIALALQYVP